MARTLSGAQKRFLEQTFPGEDCLFSPEETLVYGADASRLSAPPLAVVRPERTEQVSELLAWAQTEKMPLYPRARATNLVGGCVPDRGGVVVSTLKLNRILEADPHDFVAVAEPGVVTSDLQAHVEALNLFYPPDPASVKISTIGGNIATCAGGMRAVRYGVTRDYVLGLEAVLPGGEVVHTGGRTHKNVVGLDLTRLLVGSEGTLGFITRCTLKLLPKPEATASLLCGFADDAAALEAARSVFDAGMLPVAMEFMAREVLECIAALQGVPWGADTGAALLFKLDGGHQALKHDLERLRACIGTSSPTFVEAGLGPEEEEPLWEIRRLINPASYQVRPNKSADDVTVPRGRVREAVAGIREISDRTDLPILVFGHLGDGNLHVNVMFDAADQAEAAAAPKAKEAVLELVLGLRGSMSGEHGIGSLKPRYLDRQLSGRERELMWAIKKTFDPQNILNPGKSY